MKRYRFTRYIVTTRNMPRPGLFGFEWASGYALNGIAYRQTADYSIIATDLKSGLTICTTSGTMEECREKAEAIMRSSAPIDNVDRWGWYYNRACYLVNGIMEAEKKNRG